MMVCLRKVRGLLGMMVNSEEMNNVVHLIAVSGINYPKDAIG